MGRDRRLWVKVSTDIGRHPKMAALSDSAFRAYIEALAHAKELNQDGFIPARDARRWMPEFDELLSNGERPSVVKAEGGYQIRDFAEHQETSDAVERRREASRLNGSKGGRPPKPRNLDVNPAGVPRRKAESRVQSPETSKTYKSLSSTHPPDAGTDASSRAVLKGNGISPDRLISHIRSRTTLTVNATGAMRVALDILGRADGVKDQQRYVLGAITRSPAETEKFIYDNNLTG